MVPVTHYIILSGVVFIIGLVGVLIRRNFIVVLLAVELMLNAGTINLIAFSRSLNSLTGQIFSVFVISVAAGEAIIGLAIIIAIFRGKSLINVDEVNLMRW